MDDGRLKSITAVVVVLLGGALACAAPGGVAGPTTPPTAPAQTSGPEPTVPTDQVTETGDGQVQMVDPATEPPATYQQPDIPTAIPPTPEAGSNAVSAGIQGDFFQTYTILVAPGWANAHESDPSAPHDKLTLSKDAYSLVIEQAGAGIDACLFGGQPTPTGEAQLWVEFSNVGFITGASGNYLRGTNDGLSYTVCIQSGDGYNSVTPFGMITYTAPDPPDPTVIAQMDGMVATLKH